MNYVPEPDIIRLNERVNQRGYERLNINKPLFIGVVLAYN